MPQNLGLYNENLSVPRKQDVDAVQEQVNNLSESMGDFVTAQDSAGIVDTVPPTFGGYTVDDFVLQNQVVNSLSSTATNYPLSANQGNVLNQSIGAVSSSLQSTNQNLNQLQINVNSKLPLTGGSLSGSLTIQPSASLIGQVRNIYCSTAEPTENDGVNGDIWIVYGG